jgi:hypothetical protein
MSEAIKDDGGSAFPETRDEFDSDIGEHGAYRVVSSGGMTLRDYFAAKAMQGFIASPRGLATGNATVSVEEYADLAYKTADAMLSARSAA